MQHRLDHRFVSLIALFPRFGEAVMAAATVVIGGFCVPLAMVQGATVDVQPVLMKLIIPGILFAAGMAYRLSGRSDRIASALVAISLLAAFTLALALYNHLLLPVSAPLIDPLLFRFNALFGYDWPALVEWAARHPALSALLAHVYNSSLPQVVMLLAALGLSNRHGELDRMLMTVAIGSLVTVSFWSLFPSISISAFEAASPEAERAASLVLGREAGEQLLRFVTHGIDHISPDTMTGLIGFPSFHTVLALACMRFAWHLPLARWPFLLVNLPMFPAILLHGSHHVADVIGGVATFVLALWAAERLLRLEAAGTGKRAGAPDRGVPAPTLGTAPSGAR
jgi:hypothetical protein